MDMNADHDLVRRTSVAEVMSREPIVLHIDDSVEYAGVVLLREGISGAPVVDDHDTLVGVFSHSDVLARFAAPRVRRGPIARLDERHARARTVGEACTRPAATIGAGATIDNAARELLDNDIGRLVVVEDGAVVGLLSRSDVLKLFLPHWHADERAPAVRRLSQLSPD